MSAGGAACSHGKQGATGKPATLADQDAEAIRKLHEKDMAASKAGDFETLRSLLSEDAVVLPPDGKILRGRKEIDDNFTKMEEAMRQVEVLDYVLDFKEVNVLGSYRMNGAKSEGVCVERMARKQNGGFRAASGPRHQKATLSCSFLSRLTIWRDSSKRLATSAQPS